MGYRVKTVSAMTGIPRGTLLAWERRYDILEPDRSPSGYREYSDADVAVFLRLKTLVDEGYSISEAVALLKRPTDSYPTAESRRPAEVLLVREPPPRPLRADLPAELPDAVLRALLAFDRAAADRLVPRLGQVSIGAAADELYVPVLRRLGEAWARGDITVAQEHFASGFCREHLLAMYHALAGGPAPGLSVACATPPGERHELGLLVLALRLALRGHRVVWLGADLPVSDLCAYLATHRPRFLCLSFTQKTSRDAAVSLGRAIRAGAPPSTEIVFGGAGLEAPDGPLLEGVSVRTTFAAFEEVLAGARFGGEHARV